MQGIKYQKFLYGVACLVLGYIIVGNGIACLVLGYNRVGNGIACLVLGYNSF